MYIPRDSHVEVRTDASVDIAEFRAPVEHHYPLRHVPYAEVLADPGPALQGGRPGLRADAEHAARQERRGRAA